MTRVLVLHLSAGTGHTSAARAIGEAFQRQPGVAVDVVDVLDHVNKAAQTTISKGYNEVSTRLQPLYTMLHSSLNIPATEDALSANRLMTTLGRPFLRRFEKFVAGYNPDAIICTMQIPLHVVHAFEQERARQTPVYAVITDFSVQSTWLVEGLAGYFVASDLTRQILLEHGMPPELVHVSGIPVKLEIGEPKSREAMREKHGLPLDLPLITVFGGGIAVERIRALVERLLASSKPGVLAVVAGRNEALTSALAGLGAGPQMRLELLGFIDYVDDLVAASDLVVSKPGGLITSEVLARGTPMLVIDPIPGQEEWNADVVAGVGAGLQLRMPEMVPFAVEYLLSEPERLAAMRSQAQRIGRPHAAQQIAEQVLADLSH